MRSVQWAIRATVSVLLCVAATTPLVADTLHVPGEYPTIQAAIDAASNGDDILVAPGIYREAINLRGKQIWLHSESGPASTVVSAEGLNKSVITCRTGETADTIIEGFTVVGGRGTPGANGTEGGGLYALSSNPTVRSCWFGRNHVTTGGGAISHSGPPMLIENCRFRWNRSNPANPNIFSSGGAISSVGDVTIVDCAFDENRADISGGAVAHRDGFLLIQRSTFEANHATGDGDQYSGVGGAVRTYGNMRAEDCSFVANRVYGFAPYDSPEGGAIWTTGDFAHFVRCSFDRNKSTSSAGGIYARGATVTVENCRFERNNGFGAGIEAESSTVEIVDSVFARNESNSALAIDRSTGLVARCQFTQNAGPGIESRIGSIDIEDCAFAYNETNGGAVYAGGGAVQIRRCTFLGNRGAYCAGVSTRGGEFILTNCVFIDNVADDDGGTLWTQGESSTLVLNSLFVETRPVAGAAIVVGEDPGVTLVVNSSIIRDSDASILVLGSEGVSVNYCNVQGGFEGVGNISDDPNFVDLRNGDFHLRPDSPCIDAGDSWSVYPFLNTDYDGNPRFVGPFVDMGPYEHQEVINGFTLREPAPKLGGELNTMDAGGATPLAPVTFVYGFSAGSSPAPGCPGVEFEINEVRIAGQVVADPRGLARLEADVSEWATGRRFHMQALDEGACALSNRVIFRFD